MKHTVAEIALALCLLCCLVNGSDFCSHVWVADNGDGTYKNPVLHADYSDPDVIRVGNEFYLVSSSFECVPGLPILRSYDLVNWELIGHAVQKLVPEEYYNRPRPGCGIWAPAIRYHNNKFYIFYGDPDFGIFVVTATNITGPWSKPTLIKKARGWIDPCPFWDEDGQAYLINALAASRSGIKSVLVISKMSQDGLELLDDGVIVYDGKQDNPTIEGPKLYKRPPYYYIFAPAGGVSHGWQVVLRSTNIYGPYEVKRVLHQGPTQINGPHQGALVNTPDGRDWFVHFQDKDAFGRVVHLQPVRWENHWPIIGVDLDGDGVGEPVLSHQKPILALQAKPYTPSDSDEFNEPRLGLQWQWQANPQPNWAFPTSMGFLRLYCVPPPEKWTNFLDIPNLLLQKFPAPKFTATTLVTTELLQNGEVAGLIIFGLDYAALAIQKTASDQQLVFITCRNAHLGSPNTTTPIRPLNTNSVYLRAEISPDATCKFSYSFDNTNFVTIPMEFVAQKGRWTGSKIGIFALGTHLEGKRIGYADFDWFRIE